MHVVLACDVSHRRRGSIGKLQKTKMSKVQFITAGIVYIHLTQKIRK